MGEHPYRRKKSLADTIVRFLYIPFMLLFFRDAGYAAKPGDPGKFNTPWF